MRWSLNGSTADYRDAVPGFVHSIALGVALLGLCLLLLVFRPVTALAFESGGVTYPDTLAGKTVTFNSTLTAPPNSLLGQYWRINATTPSSPSNMPNGSVGTPLYVSFENWTSVSGSTHPWFIFFSYNQSQTDMTLPPITGVDYWARFAYDGYNGVTSWWGLKSGVNRPTVNFYEPTVGTTPIISNHDFIVWLCNNSDYFTRYPVHPEPEPGTWITPQVAVADHSIGIGIPATNPTSNYFIEYNTSGSGNVWFLAQSGVAVGGGTYGYTATISAYYRVTFNYGENGSDTVNVGFISVPEVVDAPKYLSYAYLSSAHQMTIRFDRDGVKPVSVLLQIKQGGQWVDVASTSTITTDNSSTTRGYYAYLYPVTQSGEYRILVTPGDVAFEIGNINSEMDSDDMHFAIFGDLMQYVQEFFQMMGSIFSWLPPEVANFIILAIMAMVVLGVVQLVKP